MRKAWSLLAVLALGACGRADDGPGEGAASAESLPAGAVWRIQLGGSSQESLTGPGGRARSQAGGRTVMLVGDPAGGVSFRLAAVESGQTGTFDAATFRIELPDGWECEDDPSAGEPPRITLERNDPGRVTGAIEGTVQCPSGAEIELSGTFDVRP